MQDGLIALAESLARPPERGGIELLVDLWRQEDTTVVCRRPPNMEEHPDLAVRIRGAFGRALMEVDRPVRHRPDPFRRPPPIAVMFGDFADHRGHPLPKPFVIDVDCRGTEVVVRLRVFGQALLWSWQAREALVRALAGGVSIRTESAHHVVFEPVEITSERVEGLGGAVATREAALLFHSPLVIRNGSALRVEASSLISSLVFRAEGLAAWQGLALDVDRRAIAECSAAAKTEASAMYPVRFQRSSRRQPGRSIPVIGIAGRLGLTGAIEALSNYLAIGSVAHAGSHAALGLGRYDLAVYG